MDTDPYPPPPDEPAVYSPALMLLLLLVAVMIGSMIGSGLVYTLATIRGIDLMTLLGALDERSSLATRNFIRLANLLSHFFTFSAPVLALAVLFFRTRWTHWLAVDRQPPLQLLLAGIVFIAGAFPVAQTAYWINQQLPLPDWAHGMEVSAAKMLKCLLVMDNPGELLFNLLVVAVLPAIGEELLFRGYVQQRLEQWSARPQLAVWSTAVLFSAIHLQFEGFLARLILGAALGYLFFWSRNLWVPIVAHFVFNGAQVVIQYLAKDRFSAPDLEEVQDPQWAWFALGLVMMIAAGYWIARERSREDPTG